jgi:hypothetical protein
MMALSMVVTKLINPDLQLEYSSLVDGNIANGWLLTTLLFQYVYTSLSKSEVEISESLYRIDPGLSCNPQAQELPLAEKPSSVLLVTLLSYCPCASTRGHIKPHSALSTRQCGLSLETGVSDSSETTRHLRRK